MLAGYVFPCLTSLQPQLESHAPDLQPDLQLLLTQLEASRNGAGKAIQESGEQSDPASPANTPAKVKDKVNKLFIKQSSPFWRK